MDNFLLLVQIGVAAWMVYEAIRAVTAVFPVLQPILVAAICYVLTLVPPVVLLVLGASGIVALLRAAFARPQPVATPGRWGHMSMKKMSESRVTKLP